MTGQTCAHCQQLRAPFMADQDGPPQGQGSHRCSLEVEDAPYMKPHSLA
eukprot:CAMPEP_0170615566 /NCGR_PEP_ID=MMETSP0224-20130122/25408_1 /TAXON_ID=285029 /ORGANISM="Togula jolla, Strain CCCM 725" /LENGTH=48 /DNA_ID= /DNA_START= /DNA_END= /DNA_ORIENTATION=